MDFAKIMHLFGKNKSSVSIEVTPQLAQNMILEIDLGSHLRLYLRPWLVDLIKIFKNVGMILFFIWYFHK
jgi:hypothetical protein